MLRTWRLDCLLLPIL